MLQQNFGEEVHDCIIDNIQSVVDTEMWDNAWWMLTTSGKITIRFAWEIIRNKEDIIQNFKNTWIKEISFKVLFFLWGLWRKRVPVGVVLIRNRVCDNVVCCCCKEDIQENIEHLFIQRKISKELRKYFVFIASMFGPFFQFRDSVLKW